MCEILWQKRCGNCTGSGSGVCEVCGMLRKWLGKCVWRGSDICEILRKTVWEVYKWCQRCVWCVRDAGKCTEGVRGVSDVCEILRKTMWEVYRGCQGYALGVGVEKMTWEMYVRWQRYVRDFEENCAEERSAWGVRDVGKCMQGVRGVRDVCEIFRKRYGMFIGCIRDMREVCRMLIKWLGKCMRGVKVWAMCERF